jgi:hypothetical protein
MKTLRTVIALSAAMLLPSTLLAQDSSGRPRSGAGAPQATVAGGWGAVAQPSDSNPTFTLSGGAGQPPNGAPSRPMMERMRQMQTEMQTTDGQLDALLAEMNGSTGEKKVEAIAALLNRMVQERKAMQHRMAEMHMQMMGGMPGQAGEGTPSVPERMAVREMQQRLAAEREAAEAQMQAQRAAMQAQMEAQKRQAEAERDAQRALVEQREKIEQQINEARKDAERAVAQAREEVAKSLAERDVARKQAEQAVLEARALADRAHLERESAGKQAAAAAAEARDLAEKAVAARAEAEKAIAEARREAERAEQLRAEAERARRDAEKEKK